MTAFVRSFVCLLVRLASLFSQSIVVGRSLNFGILSLYRAAAADTPPRGGGGKDGGMGSFKSFQQLDNKNK